jgi:hypothetical protein
VTDPRHSDDIADIVLTDDEVVAVAVQESQPWPVALPTVPNGDPDALAAASFRGHRSLSVRGLLNDEGGLTLSIASLCSGIPGADSFLAVFLADNSFQRAGWGVMSCHYPSTAEWIVESINPLGIHRIARIPTSEQRSYLSAMLSGGQHAGPIADSSGVDGTPTWLCVMSVAPRGCVLAAARKDEIYAGEAILREGEVAQFHSGLPVDTQTAIQRLMTNFET